MTSAGPRRALAICSVCACLGLVVLWTGAATRALGPPSTNGGTPAPGARVPVGCESQPGAVASQGTGAGDEVALTFDDGPSLTQTPTILATLRRQHARATFFEEGRHVHGREALMRSILASGDEIGNHSYHHQPDPGYRELLATDRRIRTATGFEPCLFRPPYGLIDGRVAAAARRSGLEMVLWSVDAGDDRHPGAAAIRAQALAGAAPGSIILLHDGGHHPQTPRALPGLIRGLRARGMRLVTVTRLLGGRMRFARRPATARRRARNR